MKKQVMVCGVDCRQGDANCNGYCTGKADCPADATNEMVLARARDRVANAIAEAEKACAEFAEVAKMQPETDDAMLRECLDVLQYATYHDGRYGQDKNYEKFQRPAQNLVRRIANRLGVKAYDGFGA